MSKTSPADLAVTFRSVPRRLREALGDEQPAVGTELHTQLIQAAALLGTTDDPKVIADTIDRRPAEEWDSATLDGLRAVALDVGHQLRLLAAAHRPD